VAIKADKSIIGVDSVPKSTTVKDRRLRLTPGLMTRINILRPTSKVKYVY
jgi:hypothetical protein